MPVMMPLKFPLGMISWSKNISDMPMSAIFIHIVCFDLGNKRPALYAKVFTVLKSRVVRKSQTEWQRAGVEEGTVPSNRE